MTDKKTKPEDPNVEKTEDDIPDDLHDKAKALASKMLMTSRAERKDR